MNLSIPIRKGENLSVGLLSRHLLPGTNNSLHESSTSNSNTTSYLPDIQKSLLQQSMDRMTPLGERDRILEDVNHHPSQQKEDTNSSCDQNMNDELSYLAKIDALEDIETNYPENECMHDDLNLDDIFEEPTCTGMRHNNNNHHHRIHTQQDRLGKDLQSMTLS